MLKKTELHESAYEWIRALSQGRIFGYNDIYIDFWNSISRTNAVNAETPLQNQGIETMLAGPCKMPSEKFQRKPRSLNKLAAGASAACDFKAAHYQNWRKNGTRRAFGRPLRGFDSF